MSLIRYLSFVAFAVACSGAPDSDEPDAGNPTDARLGPSDAASDGTVSNGGDAMNSDVRDAAELGVTADRYCEETVDMFCAYYLRCGRMAATDLDDCRATFLESCNAVYEPRYVSYVERGMLELSAAGIEECRQHLETVQCERQLFDLDLGCANVWVGQRSLGEACAPGIGSFVCKPGTVCTLGLDFCGTCNVAAIAGDPCGDDVRCETGAQCVDGTCVQRALPGESCEARPCVTGASCVDGTCQGFEVVAVGAACDQTRRCPYKATCRGGTCVESALLGQSCADRDCASGWCNAGTCAPYQSGGATCAGASECLSNSCESGTCAPVERACLEN